MAPVTPFARSYAHSDIRAAVYVFGMTGMATARVISAPPSLPLYREKLSYHANPCAAGNTSGQRFPYGDIRYLSVSGGRGGGKKEGGAEKRSFQTGDPLDRDASACVAYRRYRILTIRRKNVTIIFGECRSNDGCIVNWLRGKLRKKKIRKRNVCAVEVRS